MGKRKSIEKSSESPLNKNIKSSPNKMEYLPKTPIQQKPTASAQSDRKKGFKKETNKRKSLPPKLANGDDEISTKKPKIEPFTGTADLFTEEQKGISPITNNAKVKKEIKTKDSRNSSDAMDSNRAKARKEKIQRLRKVSKERFKTKLLDATAGNDVAIAEIVAHVTRLEQQRPTLTKTGKRKLKKLRKIISNAGVPEASLEAMVKNAALKGNKQHSKKNDSQSQKNKNANVKQHKIVNAEESSAEDASEELEERTDNIQESGIVNIKRKTLPQIKSKKEEEESSEEEDSESLADDESMAEEDESLVNNEMIEGEAEEDEEEEEESEDSEDNDEDNENNEVDSENSNDGANNDESSSNEDENEESGSDEDDDDDSNVLESKKNLQKQTKLKTDTKTNEDQGDSATAKSRYVLFVGNLPYDVTRQDIAEHFSKAGQVKDIRIPLEKQTNKPRGFAFIEMPDQICYEKALSLHHTFIKGRKINVLYTQGGKKNGEEKKQQIKSKNFKLQAMRQQGKLAGNVKESQKRSFRRTKQRNSK